MALLGTLSDPFNQTTLNGTNWYQFTAGGATIAYDSTGVTISYPSSSTATTDGEIDSQNTYDLTGSGAYVQVLSVPSAATTADAEFRIQTNGTNWFRWVYENGSLIAQRMKAGTRGNVFSATYNSTTHRYWRISESGGTVTFWTGVDAGGGSITWTSRGTYVHGMTITAMSVLMAATCFQAESNPGTYKFNNFNTTAPPAQSVTMPSIASTSSTFSPQIDQTIYMPYLDTTTAMYGPTVAPQSTYYHPSGTIGDGGPAFDDGAGGFISGIRFAPTQSGVSLSGVRFYAPSAGIIITPYLYLATATGNNYEVTGPSITTVAGWNFVPFDYSYMTTNGVAYIATTHQATTKKYTAKSGGFPVTTGPVTSSSTTSGYYLYSSTPTIPTNARANWYGTDVVADIPYVPPAQSVTVPLISSTNAMYQPTITPITGISMPFMPSTATMYSPTVIPPNATIVLPFMPSTSAMYAPIVVGVQTITMPFRVTTATTFAPTITPGPTSIVLPFMPSAVTMYGPSAIRSINLGFILNLQTFYDFTSELIGIPRTLWTPAGANGSSAWTPVSANQGPAKWQQNQPDGASFWQPRQ